MSSLTASVLQQQQHQQPCPGTNNHAYVSSTPRRLSLRSSQMTNSDIAHNRLSFASQSNHGIEMVDNHHFFYVPPTYSPPSVAESNDSRLPLPTAKLKDGLIKKLRRAFTFRSKSELKTSPSASVSIVQQNGEQMVNHHKHQQPQRFPVAPSCDSFLDNSTNTYLRPRRAPVKRGGVVVDPWKLNNSVDNVMLQRYQEEWRQMQASTSFVGQPVLNSIGRPLSYAFSYHATTTLNSSRSSDSTPMSESTVSQVGIVLRPPPPRYWLLAGFGWYWGPLTNAEAIAKLTRSGYGAFLVRDSEHTTARFTLSYTARGGRVMHLRIGFKDGRYLFEQNEEFESLPDLIDHAVSCSKQYGIYCLQHDDRTWNQDGGPVCLLEPVDRFREVCSLRYLCRLALRHHIHIPHILPSLSSSNCPPNNHQLVLATPPAMTCQVPPPVPQHQALVINSHSDFALQQHHRQSMILGGHGVPQQRVPDDQVVLAARQMALRHSYSQRNSMLVNSTFLTHQQQPPSSMGVNSLVDRHHSKYYMNSTR